MPQRDENRWPTVAEASAMRGRLEDEIFHLVQRFELDTAARVEGIKIVVEATDVFGCPSVRSIEVDAKI